MFPLVGGPVFGILIGMVIALFWKPLDRGRAIVGIAFTSKKVLQLAVVFLGFGLNISQVIAVGSLSLPVILSTIGVALLSAFFISKLLKIPGKTATLVGVGSSICGGSAIAATAPVIKASDEEVAQAISVIFFFNVIAALIFPTLGSILGLSNEGFALFAGTAVNDTSSVTAAAAAWEGMHSGSHVLEDATIVKLTRTLAIIPITLVLALWGSRRSTRKEEDRTRAGNADTGDTQACVCDAGIGGAKACTGDAGVGDTTASHTGAGDAGTGDNGVGDAGETDAGFSLKRSFPMFILWFIVASLITTIALACGVPTVVFDPLKVIAKFLIIMAMTAIGLNTDVIKLVKSGAKPLALGFCCCLLITATSLGVQALLGIW